MRHPYAELRVCRCAKVMGTTVIGGMLAASLIAIFLVPVSFYFIEKLVRPRKGRLRQSR